MVTHEIYLSPWFYDDKKNRKGQIYSDVEDPIHGWSVYIWRFVQNKPDDSFDPQERDFKSCVEAMRYANRLRKSYALSSIRCL